MEGDNRRTYIAEKLANSKTPVSGRTLARELGVSRQIIVGDIALLRAQGIDIIATNSGYVIADGSQDKTLVIRIKHRPEDFYDVLCTIVDEGANITGMHVEHDVYGRVEAKVNVRSRADAKAIAEKSFESSHAPLYALTGNVYFQTLQATSDVILIRVQRALHEKGYV